MTDFSDSKVPISLVDSHPGLSAIKPGDLLMEMPGDFKNPVTYLVMEVDKIHSADKTNWMVDIYVICEDDKEPTWMPLFERELRLGSILHIPRETDREIP